MGKKPVVKTETIKKRNGMLAYFFKKHEATKGNLEEGTPIIDREFFDDGIFLRTKEPTLNHFAHPSKAKIKESPDSLTFPGQPDYISRPIPEKINETHKYFETRARKNILTDLDKKIIKEAFDLIAIDSPERVNELPHLNIDISEAINRRKFTEPLHRAIDRGLFDEDLLSKIENILESLRV